MKIEEVVCVKVEGLILIVWLEKVEEDRWILGMEEGVGFCGLVWSLDYCENLLFFLIFLLRLLI